MLTPVLRKRLLTAANYAVLILMALVALFPIYFMVIASFKNTEDLFRNGIRMVFEFDNLTVANYEYTLTTKDGIYLEASVLDARNVRATKNRRNGIQLSSRSSGTIWASNLDSNGQAVKGSTTGKTGHGLGVASSQVSVGNTSMSSNKVCGASLTGTARVTVTDSRIAGNGRHGVGTTAGSRATISDTTVSRSGHNGVLASGSGTVIDLRNVTITDSRKHGLSVPTKGAATMTNTVIATSGKVNASVSDRGRLTVLGGNTIRRAKSHGIAVARPSWRSQGRAIWSRATGSTACWSPNRAPPDGSPPR